MNQAFAFEDVDSYGFYNSPPSASSTDDMSPSFSSINPTFTSSPSGSEKDFLARKSMEEQSAEDSDTTFGAIASFFRTTSIPIPRKSSPIIQTKTPPLQDVFDLTVESIHSSAIQARIELTEYNNGCDAASAFLGEQSSVVDLSILSKSELGQITRATSLDSLIERLVLPIMISMPLGISDNGDINDFFTGIPEESWIMPHLIALTNRDFHNDLKKVPVLLGDSQTNGSSNSWNTGRNNILPIHRKHSTPTLQSTSLQLSQNVDPQQGQDKFHGPVNSSSLFASTSWFSLGVVKLSKDPIWLPFCSRIIYLCDNCLFEAIDESINVESDNSSRYIIGYGQLSGATVSLKQVQHKRSFSPSHLSSSSSSQPLPSPSQSKQTPNAGSIHTVSAIEMTCLMNSKTTSPTTTFWIQGDSEHHTLRLFDALRRASSLQVEDVYEFAQGKDEVIILGRGRFNEVRMARRRRERKVAKDLREFDTSKSTGMDEFNALKLVSKEIFWDRVHSGKERPDALVREVLAQALVSDPSAAAKIKMNLIPSQISSLKHKAYKQQNNAAPFVKIYSIFETVDGFAFELELMDNVDLFDELSSQGAFPESRVQKIVRQLVFATSRCAKLGIAHRDIKLANITFSREKVHEHSQTSPQPPTHPLILPYQSFPPAHTLPPSSSFNALDQERNNDTTGISLDRNDDTDHSSGSSLGTLDKFIAASDNATSCLCNDRNENETNEDKNDNNHDNDHDSDQIIKLADFGMAGFLCKDGLLRGRCGTPGYVAPEILNAKAQQGYELNVDMFSIGVVAYTLLCGYEPFYGEDDAALIRANRNAEYEFHMPEWKDVSEEAKDWISRTLVTSAECRLTPLQALEHRWLGE